MTTPFRPFETASDPEALADDPPFIWEPGDLDDPRTTDTDDD